MRPPMTEIRVDEDGDETHESWLLIRANHVSSSPGARLFDSEIAHQHYIVVTITRCSRKRDLSHDWLHSKQTLLEMAMSAAQWGAFVSSFGNGSGVPATLQFLTGVGMVPQAPAESRLEESHKEVKNAGKEATAKVEKAERALQEAFERKAGRREMAQLLRDLHYAIANVPANMEFVAKSLTEHAENVVTKARVDIEAMALDAIENNRTLEGDSTPLLQLGAGE